VVGYYQLINLLSVKCNAIHSSIGQNIKSLEVSDVQCLMSDVRTSNGHNSATRHPIDFVFGSRLGFLASIATD